MPGSFSQERPAGAGRTLDVWFPAGDEGGQNGNAFPLTVARGRGSGAQPATYAHSTTSTGTGSVRYATGTGWNGRFGVQCFPGGAGTAHFKPGFTINPALGAAAVNAYVNDPMSCYRLLAVLSFGSGNSVAAGETGWVYSAPASNNRITTGGAAGFGFIQTGAGEVSFIRRASPAGAGAVTTVPILSGTAADILDWHVYELRVIGATATTNAQLKAFLDGRQLNLQGANGSTLDWVTDGLPNPMSSTGAIYGFQCECHADGAAAAATGLVVHRLFLQAAPDEVNLL